jgi:hypothetical protein
MTAHSKPWSTTEVDLLYRLWGEGRNDEEIAGIIGRTPKAVESKKGDLKKRGPVPGKRRGRPKKVEDVKSRASPNRVGGMAVPPLHVLEEAWRVADEREERSTTGKLQGDPPYSRSALARRNAS